MAKKLTLDYIIKAFEAEGYEVLSEKYVNSATPIKYKCPKGHLYQVSWNKWQGGRRCPYCNPKGRVKVADIEYIKSEFAKEGYILLTELYVNCDTKLKCICPKGHTAYISWDAWKSKGTRCAECRGSVKYTLDYITSIFSAEGYIILASEYKNVNTPLKCKCPKGHITHLSFANWKKGNRCKYCAGKVRHTLEFVKASFEKEGYVLLSKEYSNGYQKLDYRCSEGHEHSIAWGNWNQGQRCPSCSSCGFSKGEKELVNELKSLGLVLIENDRQLIAPYELDILIPSKNIAIEYCGLYWHSELNGKDSKYHANKAIMCEEKGIRLITLFEDEWELNRDIVVSRLKAILGISNNTVYARKCKIKEISSKEAKTFCEENHLQGYGGGSSVKLGAFYENYLISVMTFSKLSISKGASHSDCVWELHRFCSKKDYRIIGAASKMLNYFEKNYTVKEIISYADRRWSTGNVYDKLGFSFSHVTKPNYWYFKGTKKRIHRFSNRKMPNEPKHVSEWSLRQDEGWNRVWDCGNLKFIKKLEAS